VFRLDVSGAGDVRASFRLEPKVRRADRATDDMFANIDAAEKWFEQNDPEGVAFEY